jgi:lipopolysaccharide/colanic/teichoic acid biosynthesis glycosyltransferase
MVATSSLPRRSRFTSLAHVSDVSERLHRRAQYGATRPDAVQAWPSPRSLQSISASPVPLPVRCARSTCSRKSSLRAVDAFFRRQDTWLARGLARLSPTSGTTYTISVAKRSLDLTLGVPLALIAILLMVLLITVNKLLSPRQPALFLQDRVGQGDEALRIVKIRSMVPGLIPNTAQQASAGCTTFGRFIRRHYLDELPQLLQVLSGRLSLVGIRVLPREVYEGLAVSWSGERFERWRAMYAAAPPGLSGAHQVFRGAGKEDARRFHRDMFYAGHATLGFDLYLLWRTLGTTDGEHDRTSHKEEQSNAH